VAHNKNLVCIGKDIWVHPKWLVSITPTTEYTHPDKNKAPVEVVSGSVIKMMDGTHYLVKGQTPNELIKNTDWKSYESR
jgi:hypothetical protein